jgi:hypothetical protein
MQEILIFNIDWAAFIKQVIDALKGSVEKLDDFGVVCKF